MTLTVTENTPQDGANTAAAADATFGMRKVTAIAVVIPVAPSPPTPPPPKSPEVTKCQTQLNAILKEDIIYFETASAKLADAALPVLRIVVAIVKRCPSATIEVAGHTNSIQSAENNMVLSQARAQSVVDYLVENGVDRARISAVGYGETRPIATNDTADGREQNRRVEFIVK